MRVAAEAAVGTVGRWPVAPGVGDLLVRPTATGDDPRERDDEPAHAITVAPRRGGREPRGRGHGRRANRRYPGAVSCPFCSPDPARVALARDLAWALEARPATALALLDDPSPIAGRTLRVQVDVAGAAFDEPAMPDVAIAGATATITPRAFALVGAPRRLLTPGNSSPWAERYPVRAGRCYLFALAATANAFPATALGKRLATLFTLLRSGVRRSDDAVQRGQRLCGAHPRATVAVKKEEPGKEAPDNSEQQENNDELEHG